MSRIRRTFSADQKAQAVRRHLSGKEAVSDLADELGVQPGQIHNWVKQVLDQADKAFGRSGATRRTETAEDRRIEQLRAKLADKNEVIAELMEENVKANKSLGNSKGTLGSPRHPRRDCRLPQALDKTHGASGQATAGVAGVKHQQVPSVEGPLRPGP